MRTTLQKMHFANSGGDVVGGGDGNECGDGDDGGQDDEEA